jgi:hypothetical protein
LRKIAERVVTPSRLIGFLVSTGAPGAECRTDPGMGAIA